MTNPQDVDLVTSPSPTPAQKQLWDQEQGETGHAFALFQEYLNAGSDITLAEFAEKTNRTFDSIRQMSARHHWFERAAAWRQHLAALACDAVAETKTKNAALWGSRNQLFREQEWELAQQSGAVIRQLILSHLKNPSVTCSISEISNFLHVFSRLGRLASEQPTEISGSSAGANALLKEVTAHLQKLFPDMSEPSTPPVNPNSHEITQS